MAGIKIVDLPAVGRDLAATDLFEMSLVGGTGSRKITGQEIMNASKLSVNNTPVINGTAGRIFFQDAANVLQQSANLFWDNTNNRLGVGITPSATLDTITSSDRYAARIGQNTSNVDGSWTGIKFQLSTNTSNSDTQDGTANIRAYRFAAGNQLRILAGLTTIATFGGASSALLVGTTTDAGFRLDVNGTARVQGNLNVSTGGVNINGVSTFADTTTFSSSGVGIRCSGISPLINQNLSISANWAGSENVTISTITNKPQVLIVQPTANLTLTAGTHDTQRILQTFAPTSGTAVTNALTLNQTINQTGGANGITRGLYINPTLTSAFDFRAIETTAGNVLFGTGFFWDNTNSNLGIGTTPSITAGFRGAHIKSPTNTSAEVKIETTDSDRVSSLSFAHAGILRWTIQSVSGGALRIIDSVTPVVTALNISDGGNVGINTTTDAGYRLDVNGNSRINGNLRVNNILGDTGTLVIESGNSQSYVQIKPKVGNTDGIRIETDQTDIGTTGEWSSFRVLGPIFSPTSGTRSRNFLAVTPTIDQTGTASGAVRGIYYNPTLTSVLGIHYAIHTTSGRVRLEGLPTSPTGLSAGDLYNDGGIIKIV